jgi:hypothetical protein
LNYFKDGRIGVMSKRFLETSLWTQNKWFRKLDAKYKLGWIYLILNCDAVGVWEIDTELMSFIVGEQYTEDEIKSIFNDKITLLGHNKLWLKDFCKFQYGVLSEISRPHQTYIKMLIRYNLLDKVDVQSESMTNNAIRLRLTKKKKEEILNKYKYECQYCGIVGVEMVVDHIYPIVKGGDNKDDNLICVCSDCNLKKNDLTLKEFYDKYRLFKNLDRVSKILQSLKEKEKEKDKDKEKDKERHRYGKYKHVLLTDTEKQKLIDKFTYNIAMKKVQQLDEGIELKGYKYRNHYLAINKWHEKDRKQNPEKYPVKIKESKTPEHIVKNNKKPSKEKAAEVRKMIAESLQSKNITEV